jgi:hypothetical protein
MSAIFYTHRDGKRESAYKYEEVEKIWYTKDKSKKDQISIMIGDNTYSSWGLTPKDIELTQKSHEEACLKYNQRLAKIELSKKKRPRATKLDKNRVKKRRKVVKKKKK